jgi:hypothetical protein
VSIRTPTQQLKDRLHTSLVAGKQALTYYFTDELREFLEAALEWHNSHNRADITPFLRNYGERLKTRLQVGLYPNLNCWRRRTDLLKRMPINALSGKGDNAITVRKKKKKNGPEDTKSMSPSISIAASVVNSTLARVVSRLEVLGWGEELKKHKDWYEGMQSLPPMNSSKPVTDKGTAFAQKYHRALYLTTGYSSSLEHLQGTYPSVREGSTGQTTSRGTCHDDKISVSRNRKDCHCL